MVDGWFNQAIDAGKGEAYHPVISTLMAVVATSQQVALVPASYARQKWPHVRFIRLEQGIPADLCVLHAPPLAGQPATTAIRHFIDTMSEQMNLPERG